MKIRQTTILVLLLMAIPLVAQTKVEKWRTFEIVLKGESAGNPFVDVQVSADFSNGTIKKND